MDDFKRFFFGGGGISIQTFQIICEQFGTLEEFTPGRPGSRSAVPIDKQLLSFLWYIGSLEPLCRIADRFNVTEFSVLRIRKRICQAVLSNFKTKYIVWPNDQQERQTVIDTLTNKRGFPDVTGAIDSTHIQIRPPEEHPQTYVNRKGYHSIILQCVCREDMRYIHCFAGWPRSCHDSRAFRSVGNWREYLWT